MYVDIVISNIFYLNKHFFFFLFLFVWLDMTTPPWWREKVMVYYTSYMLRSPLTSCGTSMTTTDEVLVCSLPVRSVRGTLCTRWMPASYLRQLNTSSLVLEMRALPRRIPPVAETSLIGWDSYSLNKKYRRQQAEMREYEKSKAAAK